MAIHLQRNLIFASALLLLVCYGKPAPQETAKNSEEDGDDDDDSSSEETVEESNEQPQRRRRRSAEIAAAADTGAGGDRPSMPRAGIPGLPDPATIIKIAEIVQTVGEKVIPILLEGKSPSTALADFTAERLNRNLQFLQNFQQQIDTFTEQLRVL